MGRFVYNQQTTRNSIQIDEKRLRRPEADSDLTGTDFYQNRTIRSEAYTQTNAGFHPGPNNSQINNQNASSGNTGSSNKLSYLKAEIDFMVDGFMRELLDFEAFANLSPEIQQEIMGRYPQFFN